MARQRPQARRDLSVEGILDRLHTRYQELRVPERPPAAGLPDLLDVEERLTLNACGRLPLSPDDVAHVVTPPGDAYEGPDPEPAAQPAPPMNGHHRYEPEEVPELVIAPKSSTWPEPLANEAYHGLAGEIVARIEPHSEADPAGILFQFLAAFGNAMGREAYQQVGRRRHYANLYVVLVGATSYGGKGDAWSWVDHLMGSSDGDWHSESVFGGLSSGEGLIKATDDITLRHGHRALFLEEEFGGVLKAISRDGNILSAILRQGWDGGRLRVATRNNPLKCEEAHISVIGHVTPGELAKVLDGNETSNGFANRILWVKVRRSKLLAEGGGDVDTADLAISVRLALETAWSRKCMGRSPRARRLWCDTYERLRRERPGLLGLICARAAPQVLRLSLIYAILDNAHQVDVAHLKAALAVWEYSERCCTHLFGETVGDALADAILEALRASPEGLKQVDIHALLGRHKSGADIGKALGILVENGLVRKEAVKTRGRSGNLWKCAN